MYFIQVEVDYEWQNTYLRYIQINNWMHILEELLWDMQNMLKQENKQLCIVTRVLTVSVLT